ncbi:hypothetical protein DXV24_21350 [Escherichia albertii]|nr:hypothetical protein [Escherichia albertii]
MFLKLADTAFKRIQSSGQCRQTFTGFLAVDPQGRKGVIQGIRFVVRQGLFCRERTNRFR